MMSARGPLARGPLCVPISPLPHACPQWHLTVAHSGGNVSFGNFAHEERVFSSCEMVFTLTQLASRCEIGTHALQD